jgi:predicted metalloprotease
MSRRQGGGRGGLPMAGIGGGGLLGVIVVIALLLLTRGGGGSGGFGLPDVVGQMGASPAAQGAGVPESPEEATELEQFVAFVLDDTQATWADLFQQAGRQYQPAQLFTFTGAVSTGGCGNAPSSVGPFYCPADRSVYVDLTFFEELNRRFGAPGDFAQAYVIAHEIGHHVQNELGIDDEVRQAVQQEPGRQNELSVRQELQADCFAGVWAYSTYQRGLLEQGDLEEGLGAAAAVGDDRLTGGNVPSDSFTHGTSEQRSRWFRTGFDSGRPEDCDTFSGDV